LKRRGQRIAGLATTVTVAWCSVLPLSAVISGTATAAPATTTSTSSSGGTSSGTSNVTPGPRPQYRCNFNVGTDAFTGAYGTASAIGWLGDHNSVITCLGGTFVVQDGPAGYFTDYGFGIYDGQRTTWADVGGYLPEQVTTFDTGNGATVAITEFADEVTVGGNPFVAVYARVHIDNPTGTTVKVDPGASPTLVPLDDAPNAVGPQHAVDHDYAVVSDRFGAGYPWPTTQALADGGGFVQHEAHMRAFWNAQLAHIAQVDVPNKELVNAYKSGFITTELTRSGDQLDTGVNGYESEFSHDVIGILTNLFTQGEFGDAHALLTEARAVVGSQSQYVDGLWTYAVPWAIYLMKTGDIAFVEQNFDTSGPAGPATQPSIEASAHAIAADRSGPTGTMEATNDIDTQGTWTVDDFEALLGLAAYRYLAGAIGNTTEVMWAGEQYQSLLQATNAVLAETIATNHLDYLPCSLTQPNTANRCNNPKDANWTSPFGFGGWAWEAGLLDAAVTGPGATLIDATYDYGFARLEHILPRDTTGGFPGDYYSSAYNAAQGSAGLASRAHRDQGILDLEFMVAHGQSGPWSWWESSSAPDARSPWVGSHPASGQGSSPHAWGIAGSDKVLLDSIVAQRADGSVLVGRGVPPQWLTTATPIAVTNFPTTDGKRSGFTIDAHGTSVSLTVAGTTPSGKILFELPSFVGNVASSSAGTVDQHNGTVTLAPGIRHVTVTLRRAP
jgi:hypothetical protein